MQAPAGAFRARFALPFLPAALLAAVAHGQCEVQRLAPGGPTSDFFGRDLAAFGDTMLVGHSYEDLSGADAGAVYVYQRTDAGWAEVDVLLAADAAPHDRFGEYVAFDGERAAVSAIGVDAGGVDYAGAVYVLRRDGSTWVQEAKLLDPAPGPNPFFSRRVAIAGDVAATIGGGYQLPGEVHVFARRPTGWVFLQTLPTPSGLDDGFGRDLAFHAATLWVGAPYALDGRVYAYRRTGALYALDLELAPTAGAPAQFGVALATDGARLVVGDVFDAGLGAVHVFSLAGGSPVLEAYLVPDTPESGGFGADVALERERVVVGAPQDDDLAGIDSGAAFEFERIDGEWTQTAKIYPQDPGGPSGFDNGFVRFFGRRVALVGGEALLATWDDNDDFFGPTGAVRVFQLDDLGAPFCLCPEAAPCGNVDPVRGCDNARGHGARLHAAGSASVAADDLRFATLILPPNQSGALFMGTEAIRVPFGNGLRCVGEAGTGVFRFPVRVTTTWGTHLEGPGVVGFTNASFPPAGHIAPGDTWLFQTWYRDPAGPCGAPFNVSSALAIQFSP